MTTDAELLQAVTRAICGAAPTTGWHVLAAERAIAVVRASGRMAPASERMFPILGGSPKSIPWSVIEPFDGQAKNNHSQNLERLAQRGGLGPSEAIDILTAQSYGTCRLKRADATLALVALVKERQAAAAIRTGSAS